MGPLLACAEFWVMCAMNPGVVLTWEMSNENRYLSATPPLQAQIVRQEVDRIITQL